MTERKNIKVEAEIFDRLKAEKETYENWNHFFDRVLNELHE